MEPLERGPKDKGKTVFLCLGLMKDGQLHRNVMWYNVTH
jgi:hypothetical protein